MTGIIGRADDLAGKATRRRIRACTGGFIEADAPNQDGWPSFFPKGHAVSFRDGVRRGYKFHSVSVSSRMFSVNLFIISSSTSI